jgi:flagellar protein FliO/FliZ
MNPSPNGADTIGAAQTWPLVSLAAPATVEPLAGNAGQAPVDATPARDRDGAGKGALADDAAQPADAAATAQQSPDAVNAVDAAPAETTATDLPAKGDNPAQSTAQAQPAAPVLSAAATTTATTQQAAAPAFAAPQSSAGMVGTTVATLLLVIGFILLLAWLAKRMPGLGGASNPALKVVGSLALGPRERVVVVDVGGTQLLLATGPGGTRTLHTLEQPLPVATPTTSPFAQVLAQQFGKKKP